MPIQRLPDFPPRPAAPPGYVRRGPTRRIPFRFQKIVPVRWIAATIVPILRFVHHRRGARPGYERHGPPRPGHPRGRTSRRGRWRPGMRPRGGPKIPRVRAGFAKSSRVTENHSQAGCRCRSPGEGFCVFHSPAKIDRLSERSFRLRVVAAATQVFRTPVLATNRFSVRHLSRAGWACQGGVLSELISIR